MPRYLLDTNICIYIQRQRQPKLVARFERLSAGGAALSGVTCGELLYGAEKSSRREEVLEKLQRLTELVPVLPLPTAASSAYGMIRAQLEARGEPIGNNHLWIAAHALSAELTLVTKDTREFKRVPKLAVENWTV